MPETYKEEISLLRSHWSNLKADQSMTKAKGRDPDVITNVKAPRVRILKKVCVGGTWARRPFLKQRCSL